MRPGSIDEVIAAYTAALANRQTTRDKLRVVLEMVERLKREDAEQTTIIRELRDEVRRYTDVQKTGEVAA